MKYVACLVVVLGLAVTTPPASAQEQAVAAYNAGRFAEAAERFAEAAESRTGISAANAWYNAACSYALHGEADSAILMFKRAIEHGFRDYNHAASDSDLDLLRADPRFADLLAGIKPPPITITTNLKHNAEDAEFVFKDAENFIGAMALVADGAELVPTLEAEYFGRATPGLRQMLKKYPFTAAELAEAIRQHPEKYDRIPETLAQIRSRVDEFRAAYAGLEELMPDVVFPPTYFLVDRHRGIGSGSPDGQLITIETRTAQSISTLETLLVHELVHFQQLVATGPDEFYAIFGPKKTLLALTIREGTAEFFADRVTGRMTQERARAYCLANEAEIWRRFQAMMHERETTNWMWSQPEDPDVPRDLAYVFGARIVEAYYDRAEDQRQAAREIIAVVDYPTFLERAGYNP